MLKKKKLTLTCGHRTRVNLIEQHEANEIVVSYRCMQEKLRLEILETDIFCDAILFISVL